MDDLISVIVPVYNVEDYIDCCVESIVNQSYQKLEIILVNDGSNDKSPAICDSWAYRDSRIKVIHKSNGGLSDARNAGMMIATGVFIGFVDSDDWIASEMYERLHAKMVEDGSDICACSVEMIWPDHKTKMLTVTQNRILNRSDAQKALINETLIKQPVWYKLYKREVIGEIYFEKGKFHEDVYWSYQVIGNAKSVSLIDYTGYYYRQRSTSIMGASYSLKRLDVIDAYCARYKYISREFPELSITAKRSILLNCIYHAQMAVKYLSGYEQTQALEYLESIAKQYRLNRFDYKNLKWSHRLWLLIGSKSLKVVAKLKNTLGVGL